MYFIGSADLLFIKGARNPLKFETLCEEMKKIFGMGGKQEMKEFV